MRLLLDENMSDRRLGVEKVSGTENGFLRPMCPISVPDTLSGTDVVGQGEQVLPYRFQVFEDRASSV